MNQKQYVLRSFETNYTQLKRITLPTVVTIIWGLEPFIGWVRRIPDIMWIGIAVLLSVQKMSNKKDLEAIHQNDEGSCAELGPRRYCVNSVFVFVPGSCSAWSHYHPEYWQSAPWQLPSPRSSQWPGRTPLASHFDIIFIWNWQLP